MGTRALKMQERRKGKRGAKKRKKYKQERIEIIPWDKMKTTPHRCRNNANVNEV